MSTTFELAAGVIMSGFDGLELDAATEALLARVPFAGYVLFARNVDSVQQVRALTDRLRAYADPSPLVAIDQEGGRVARLRTGVEAIPPMMALGATRDVALAHRAGEAIAFDLRRAGCTVDFAPVLDLALHASNTVIGARTFGTSTHLVAELGSAVASGLRDGGIAPVIKHFPGHGDTEIDSHLALPRVDASESLLRTRDLMPFYAACSSADAIMAAHVVATAFDPVRPASLAPSILTGLLRGEWKYDGVCFTDCMQMDAIARGIGTVEGVAAAIAAGADCAIVSHDLELAVRAAEHLACEADSGRISRERLCEAHERVMRMRGRAALPLDVEARSPFTGVGRAIARRAVTLVRGVAHADPTASMAIRFAGVTTDGAQGRLNVEASLAAHAPALRETVLPIAPSEHQISRMIASVRASRRRPIVLTARAHLEPAQRRAVDLILADAPDSLVVSTREPYDVTVFAQARHLLAIYGDADVSLAGLADVIFGDGRADGVMPVDL